MAWFNHASRTIKIPTLVGMFIVASVYAATLAPSLTWTHSGADGGDLITAVALKRLPHPPGYPLYLIVARWFIQLPWGDPAWRLNLMSAVGATVASGLVIAIARKWLRASTVESISAGICFGLAPAIWSQAVITEVYALAICCAVFVLYLIATDATVGWISLAWGVALGAHPLIIFLAPMILWRVGQDRAHLVYKLIQMILCTIIGWDLVYGFTLPLFNITPTPWGDITTLDGWWAFVNAEIYHGYLFALTPSATPQKIFLTIATLANQFTIIGATLALVGLLDLCHKQHALAITSLIIVGMTGLFAIVYNTSDSVVYLIFATPLCAIWLATGFQWTLHRLGKRWSMIAMVLIPILQIGLFWGEMNLHDDHTALIWANRVLDTAPPRAILVTAQDEQTFTLWYAHDVLGKRSDVTIVDRDLWGLDSYRKMLANSLGTEMSIENNARATQRPLIDPGENP